MFAIEKHHRVIVWRNHYVLGVGDHSMVCTMKMRIKDSTTARNVVNKHSTYVDNSAIYEDYKFNNIIYDCNYVQSTNKDWASKICTVIGLIDHRQCCRFSKQSQSSPTLTKFYSTLPSLNTGLVESFVYRQHWFIDNYSTSNRLYSAWIRRPRALSVRFCHVSIENDVSESDARIVS